MVGHEVPVMPSEALDLREGRAVDGHGDEGFEQRDIDLEVIAFYRSRLALLIQPERLYELVERGEDVFIDEGANEGELQVSIGDANGHGSTIHASAAAPFVL
jgi:hypothetical protein